MQPVEIVRVDGNQARLEQAFMIRRRVFVEEQRVPLALEFDSFDARAIHLLASVDQRPVGTLRLRLPEPALAKIERVAVLPEARGLEIGRRLLAAALTVAGEQGARETLLHAQVRAQGFYQRLGFDPVGETFMEDGILHVAMRRPLHPGQENDAA